MEPKPSFVYDSEAPPCNELPPLPPQLQISNLDFYSSFPYVDQPIHDFHTFPSYPSPLDISSHSIFPTPMGDRIATSIAHQNLQRENDVNEDDGTLWSFILANNDTNDVHSRKITTMDGAEGDEHGYVDIAPNVVQAQELPCVISQNAEGTKYFNTSRAIALNIGAPSSSAPDPPQLASIPPSLLAQKSIPLSPQQCNVFPFFQGLTFILRKELSNSDVNHTGRIILPKMESQARLPTLIRKEGITLTLFDLRIPMYWTMKYRYWMNNRSKMYVLENTGGLIRRHGLENGDFIGLYKDNEGHHFIYALQVERSPSDPSTSMGRYLGWANKETY